MRGAGESLARPVAPHDLGLGLDPVLELVAGLEAALLVAVVGGFLDLLADFFFGRVPAAHVALHRRCALLACGIARRCGLAVGLRRRLAGGFAALFGFC